MNYHTWLFTRNNGATRTTYGLIVKTNTNRKRKNGKRW